MDMASSLRASTQGLALVDQARRRKGWTKTWTATWWQTAHTSQATLRRFWRGMAIQRETFIAIFQAVELSNWEDIAVATLPELDLPLGEMYEHSLEDSLRPIRPVILPLPAGPVDLASAFYIERPPIESRCYETIIQPGALIRVKAPRQMGKTSLVERILSSARKQKCRTVRLNLLQAEDAKLSNLNHFLRWFCACVSQKLRLPSELDNYWDTERGSIVNCTTYFQEHLLEQLDSPLVLALDEVDRVFQFPTVAQGFFPMLRSWYEEARIDDLWEKLRLVVVHSTEDYGALDLNQSPFNVGLPVELTEFTPEQVSDLAQRHQCAMESP